MFDPTLVTCLAWTLIKFISLEIQKKVKLFFNLRLNLKTVESTCSLAFLTSIQCVMVDVS